jgi:coniferyl-aldehyde dehydrogenase
MLEIIPVLNAIRYTRRNLGAWMRPETRPVDLTFQPGRAWIRYEPLGVIGIIVPWNYPLLLSLSPFVDAIAAGNLVMIKPSELTPCFSELPHNLISSHFDTTEVTVITGGPSIAREFARLPFDRLIFIGSTSIGREVMKAAAENLTPVTLELGGKSPRNRLRRLLPGEGSPKHRFRKIPERRTDLYCAGLRSCSNGSAPHILGQSRHPAWSRALVGPEG